MALYATPYSVAERKANEYHKYNNTRDNNICGVYNGEEAEMNPKCPECNSKRYVNTMNHWFGVNKWYLCSHCGWHNLEKEEEGVFVIKEVTKIARRKTKKY